RPEFRACLRCRWWRARASELRHLAGESAAGARADGRCADPVARSEALARVGAGAYGGSENGRRADMSPQRDKMANGHGFIAALDQSGGSTPKALRLYGVPEDAYSDDEQMFGLIHQMRTRIITSPAFTGDRILGAILFEQTMDREIEGRGSADYLWSVKNVVPFLKVDKGLADETDGVQVMRDIPGLDG